MDCRKLLWLGGIVVAGLVGCTRREVVKSDAPAAAQTAASRKRGRDAAAREVDAKPESLVKIAEAQAQVAADESMPAEQRRQNVQLAKNCYRRAAQLDPNYMPAYLGMARVCSLWGEHESAAAVLDEALAKNPNQPAMWHERGLVMGRQRRFDEALNSFVQAHRLDPANAQYVKAVGLMNARMGRAEDAVGWLVRAMAEADARYNVGRMMAHVGNPDEARRQFQLALRAEPGHPASLAALGQGAQPEAPAIPEPVHVAGRPAVLAGPAVQFIVETPAAVPSPPERPAIPAAPAAVKPPVVKIGFEPDNS